MAQLERTVDRLVQALAPSPESLASLDLNTHEYTTPSDIVRQHVEVDVQQRRMLTQNPPMTTALAPVSPNSPNCASSIVTPSLHHLVTGGPPPSQHEDTRINSLFALFREDFMPTFPFVILPRTSASEFQKEKPLLFKVILMAASYQDRSFQHSVGNDILKELSERIVIKGEKSLELLQALLVYLAW